jgi:hypothetical protein
MQENLVHLHEFTLHKRMFQDTALFCLLKYKILGVQETDARNNQQAKPCPSRAPKAVITGITRTIELQL